MNSGGENVAHVWSYSMNRDSSCNTSSYQQLALLFRFYSSASFPLLDLFAVSFPTERARTQNTKEIGM